MEEFRDIKGYEGFYQVSNYGRVKSLDRVIERINGTKRKFEGIILNPVLNTRGYLYVSLYKESKQKVTTVHSLVAKEFLNHKACGYFIVINHKDFNKQNNHVDNLEIVTQRVNTNKKHIKSASQYVGVHWNKNNKKWASSIFINRKHKYLGYFINEIDAHEAYQKELAKISIP